LAAAPLHGLTVQLRVYVMPAEAGIACKASPKKAAQTNTKYLTTPPIPGAVVSARNRFTSLILEPDVRIRPRSSKTCHARLKARA
jgi:hypothetical protein